MKLKNSTKIDVQQELKNDGLDEKSNGNSESVKLTEADREKGNFNNFNISTKTIQKLKGNIEFGNLFR